MFRTYKNQWLLPVILLLMTGALVCGAALAPGLADTPKPSPPKPKPSSPKLKPSPPMADVIPYQSTVHGEILVDNYFWLREKDNPRVQEHIKAENRYTEAMMQHTKPLQKRLYRELLSRIKQTDLSVPEKRGDYYYYSRTEEGKDYAIHCRKKGSLEADEEIILDENSLAEGHEYFSLGLLDVSPDHRLLMYSVDTTGAESYSIYFKDLAAGTLYDEEIKGSDSTGEWANDNKTIFYVTLDQTNRPFRLYRHVLGTGQDKDIKIFEEKNEAYSLFVSKTKDEKYLLLSLESNTTSEYRFLEAGSPEGTFAPVHRRQHQMEYSVEHHDGRFLIVTNDGGAFNFKLMQTPISKPGKENWTELIAHREWVKLDGIDVFKNYLVIYERSEGLPKIKIRNMQNDAEDNVDFPEKVYTVWPEGNREFESKLLRFSYSSLVTPETVYDYNMDTRERELKKQEEVLGGYEPDLYRTERVFARAKDGTKVPISLVYKKKLLKKNGTNPLLLEGYGAYGSNSDPYFFTTCLALLDRGFVYAIPHVRGGEEMGRLWYKQGKLLRKKNTFNDFIACAEHLIKEGFTASDKLVIRGESAGGLLMGAVTNMRPDLFGVVIAKVPFVDSLNTMLDASLPLTVTEYEEWGNPNEKVYFDYIRSYSPYDNIEDKDYPTMLVLTSLNDVRVMYWEPLKWVAKLRLSKTDHNLLLMKITLVAGHGGASGLHNYLRDVAFEYAFIFDRLGIKR